MRRVRFLIVAVALSTTLAGLVGISGTGLAQVATPEAVPVATTTIEIGGIVETPRTLTVVDLQGLGLAVETVDVTFQSGGESEDHTFTGVRLLDVLIAAGIPAGPDERNPLLKYYVVVTANDGYQVVFSGGELDPNFGDTPILLAWEQDGAPLEGADGPVRTVVPGDLRGGRYVHGGTRIDLLAVDAHDATPAA